MKKHYFYLPLLFCCFVLNAQLPQLNLVQVATGFSRPVDIQNCGDERIFVVEKVGRIRIMSKSGVVKPTPFLDITSQVLSSGNEQGLLGLAFSPNYKQDGFFYVNYTTGTGSGSTRISRFSVSPTDSNQAIAGSEVVLLTFTQPYTNHNGGSLRFGPDGYLYDGQGDGGSQNDPNGNGQSIYTYLAKILRLDVTNQTTYAIPPDNPFIGIDSAKPEIWAFGMRNPWRFSFDRITGDFWIGDVGQGTYEEIDFQAAGDTGGHNYGWRCREGLHAGPNTSVCPYSNYTDPVFEYTHSGGNCSVTGGYVYRGTQHSALWGRYLLTDYCSGVFWSIKQTAPTTFDPDTLQDFLNNQYMSFGEDNVGELYVTAENGRVYRITETTNCNPVAFISLNDSVEGCTSVKLTALKGDTLSYQWYNASGLINGATANEYTTSVSDWYKVKVSKAQAGCESMSDSIYVTVHDTTALVKNITDTVFCSNETPVTLTGAVTPVGGTFSGSGISGGNVFNPATVAPDNATLNYLLTDANGCTSAVNFNVLVATPTALSVDSTNILFCASDDPDLLLDGFITPTGGVFSGTDVTNNNFNTQVPGSYTAYYTYTNSNGCQSTDSLTILAAICEGINEVNNRLQLQVYPNPATNQVTISLTSYYTSASEICLTDITGRRCYINRITLNAGLTTLPVDVSMLPKGIYTLAVTNQHGHISRKLVVQ